jgi:hypothetical protein
MFAVRVSPYVACFTNAETFFELTKFYLRRAWGMTAKVSAIPDIANNRKVLCGHIPANQILALPTNENVREYLVDAVGKKKRALTQVTSWIGELGKLSNLGLPGKRFIRGDVLLDHFLQGFCQAWGIGNIHGNFITAIFEKSDANRVTNGEAVRLGIVIRGPCAIAVTP